MKRIKIKGFKEEGKLLHISQDADGDVMACIVWPGGNIRLNEITNCIILDDEPQPLIKDIKVVRGDPMLLQATAMKHLEDGYEAMGDVEHHVVDGKLVHCLALVKVERSKDV